MNTIDIKENYLCIISVVNVMFTESIPSASFSQFASILIDFTKVLFNNRKPPLFHPVVPLGHISPCLLLKSLLLPVNSYLLLALIYTIFWYRLWWLAASFFVLESEFSRFTCPLERAYNRSDCNEISMTLLVRTFGQIQLFSCLFFERR